MKVIYLIKLGLDSPIYLTDCHRDFLYNGDNYVSGKVFVTQSVAQKAEPSANDFSLDLSGVDQTLISAFHNNPYKGKQCLILKAHLNDDETIDFVETWLDGEMNKYTTSVTPTSCKIKLTVGSIFSAFESVQTPNITNAFADTINEDRTLYWGKTSPTVSPRSAGGVSGGIDGTSDDTVQRLN